MNVQTDFLVGLLRPYKAAIIDQLRLGGRWKDIVPTLSLCPQLYEAEAEFFPLMVDVKALTVEKSNSLLTTLRDEHQSNVDLTAQVLLSSDAEGDTLRKHWLSHLVIPMAGQTRALLRSYDPRVFLQLCRILSSAQLKSLFGPITIWTIYWQGAWLSFDAPQVASAYLQPNALQSGQIQRIESINEVLSLLEAPSAVLPERAKLAPKSVPTYGTDAVGYDAMSERIDSLLLHAEQLGWSRSSDAVLFALLGLLLSPGWHQHPNISALLAKADSTEQTLQDVLSLLPRQEWAQLSTGLVSIV